MVMALNEKQNQGTVNNRVPDDVADQPEPHVLISAVVAAGPGVESQAPDAVDANGIATLRVPFWHAAPLRHPASALGRRLDLC
jgi:hypothetical protein